LPAISSWQSFDDGTDCRSAYDRPVGLEGAGALLRSLPAEGRASRDVVRDVISDNVDGRSWPYKPGEQIVEPGPWKQVERILQEALSLPPEIVTTFLDCDVAFRREVELLLDHYRRAGGIVLQDGRRLRIGRSVDEQTLRAVLAAVGPEGC